VRIITQLSCQFPMLQLTENLKKSSEQAQTVKQNANFFLMAFLSVFATLRCLRTVRAFLRKSPLLKERFSFCCNRGLEKFWEGSLCPFIGHQNTVKGLLNITSRCISLCHRFSRGKSLVTFGERENYLRRRIESIRGGRGVLCVNI
jgi:hypothetical protein